MCKSASVVWRGRGFKGALQGPALGQAGPTRGRTSDGQLLPDRVGGDKKIKNEDDDIGAVGDRRGRQLANIVRRLNERCSNN